jgi:hypothetical protein
MVAKPDLKSSFQIQNRFEIWITNLCKIQFLLINFIKITLSGSQNIQKLYNNSYISIF